MAQTFTLPGGIRCIYLPLHAADITHLALIVDAGSRDEMPGEEGMAHFVEHMLFKGTKKRQSMAIISRMDSVGAELNAYTTREKTCLYSTFQNQYLGRAAELMADMVFHSHFPVAELAKEKKVITDEILMYRDSPEESIFDDFQQHLFSGHPLGGNILGNPEGIAGFTSAKLNAFVKRHYLPEHMVVAVATSLSWKQVQRHLTFCFAMERKVSRRHPALRKPPRKGKTFNLTEQKEFNQSHFIAGGWAYPVSHPHRHVLTLLSNVLGGPAMNSRLGLVIREKKGYTYSVYSDVSSFTDSGVFSVYFGCDAGYLEKCRDLVYTELKKMCSQQPGSLMLHRAKRQYCGQIAIAEENKASLIASLANGLIDRGKILTLPEVLSKIESITASQWLSVANEVFHQSQLSSLTWLS